MWITFYLASQKRSTISRRINTDRCNLQAAFTSKNNFKTFLDRHYVIHFEEFVLIVGK